MPQHAVRRAPRRVALRAAHSARIPLPGIAAGIHPEIMEDSPLLHLRARTANDRRAVSSAVLLASLAVSSETVVLWDFPESDHSAWVAAGCGSGTYESYRRNLTEMAKAAQAAGKRLLVVRTSVQEMLALRAKLGFPPTPDGYEKLLRFVYGPRA
jgi:hypothetical protein